MFTRTNVVSVTLRSLAIGILTVTAFGQIPAPGSADGAPGTPRFQVATIKPSQADEPRRMQIQGNRFATTGTSVIDLLKYAYGLHEQEIVGPKWLDTQKFDLVGDPETQARPSTDEFKKMMQNLLADRFHLMAHRETRDLSVFEIVPAKGGPKLTKSIRPPDDPPTVGYRPGYLTAGNATLVDFAAYLQRFVTDRAVFDLTGITGKYDWSLRWTPDNAQTEPGRQTDDSTFPGLFTAIQEQLGLKLQEGKHPAQVFVVDRIEMPSEN
jgi:uncharacterized protein (TIGR03435 family)